MYCVASKHEWPMRAALCMGTVGCDASASHPESQPMVSPRMIISCIGPSLRLSFCAARNNVNSRLCTVVLWSNVVARQYAITACLRLRCMLHRNRLHATFIEPKVDVLRDEAVISGLVPPCASGATCNIEHTTKRATHTMNYNVSCGSSDRIAPQVRAAVLTAAPVGASHTRKGPPFDEDRLKEAQPERLQKCKKKKRALNSRPTTNGGTCRGQYPRRTGIPSGST